MSQLPQQPESESSNRSFFSLSLDWWAVIVALALIVLVVVGILGKVSW